MLQNALLQLERSLAWSKLVKFVDGSYFT